MHADVGEELLAGILQTGPKEIHHIVDYQETIVIALTYIYYNRWILLVMTLDVELQLLGELACVDGGRLFAIVTHVFQNGTCAFFQQFLTFIDIV